MKAKKIFRILFKSILTIIGLVLIYLAVGFGLSKITVDKEKTAPDEMEIFILTNGVHTDIVVPVKSPHIDWSKKIKYSNTVAKDSTMRYLGMGWGDKGFYLETPTWADLKFSTAFKATFGLSTTAIHTTFFDTLIENESCKRILISNEQYTRLVDFITNSFELDENSQPIYIETNANYGNDDAFYEAKGSYSMFRTCNSWANQALKVSGQKSCAWTAFDTGIFEKYE